MDWIYIVILSGLGLAIFHLYDAMRRRAFMAKLIAKAKAGELEDVSLEDPGKGVIRIAEDAFSLERPDHEPVEVKWEEIARITAYKADLFSHDLICWGFTLTGHDDSLEVHEEMLGFGELQNAVEARYGVALRDWWEQVAFPAFAENVTVIWPKSETDEPPAENA